MREKYVEWKGKVKIVKFGQEGAVSKFEDVDRESLEANTIIKEISFLQRWERP